MIGKQPKEGNVKLTISVSKKFREEIEKAAGNNRNIGATIEENWNKSHLTDKELLEYLKNKYKKKEDSPVN